MEILNNLQYNSTLILSFFFISLLALVLNYLSRGYTNNVIFSSYRSALFDPCMYIRMFTYAIGHENWKHFSSNFLYILLIGPMIEEKYGTMNLLIMMLITAVITAVINLLLTNKRILGASGIVFMLIVLSSFVNIQSGKIPLTLILIFIFYIINEIIDGLFKKDNVSHLTHLLGAVFGLIFGFYLG